VLVFPLITLLTFASNEYWRNVCFSILLFALVATAWNLLAGFTGYISFGHGGLFAVGAYTAANLANWPIWLAIPAAGLVTAAVGVAFAVPSLRTRGLFFAILTLGLSQILLVVVLNLPDLTGGSLGLVVQNTQSQDSMLIALCVILVPTVLLSISLPRTNFGRQLIALRSNEVAAAACGINVWQHKMVMFLLSAFATGMAGAVYGSWLGFLEPSDLFSNDRLVAILAMNIFGGLAVPLGPVLGAFILGSLGEVTWAALPFLHQAVYGLCILIFGIWVPRGVLGAWRARSNARAAEASRARLYSNSAGAAAKEQEAQVESIGGRVGARSGQGK
jgi:branched-chain amino acid transport system permease protein